MRQYLYELETFNRNVTIDISCYRSPAVARPRAAPMGVAPLPLPFLRGGGGRGTTVVTAPPKFRVSLLLSVESKRESPAKLWVVQHAHNMCTTRQLPEHDAQGASHHACLEADRQNRGRLLFIFSVGSPPQFMRGDPTEKIKRRQPQ